MRSPPEPQLVNRIYEAAAVPELWRGVLADFAHQAGLKDAILIAARGTSLRWIGSAPAFEKFATDHYAFEDGPERTQRLLAAQHPEFVTDLDVYTAQEIADRPLFRDFIIPRGYGCAVGTAIPIPSGDTIIIHAEGSHVLRPVSKDTIARLDLLRPHFARAALLSARLELERVRAAAETLQLLGLPGAVVGRGGRTLAANDLLVDLMPDVLQDRPSRLALANTGANALFADAIAHAEAIEGAAVELDPYPIKRRPAADDRARFAGLWRRSRYFWKCGCDGRRDTDCAARGADCEARFARKIRAVPRGGPFFGDAAPYLRKAC